ncbi:hypothetical protein CEXT_656171 [Caerostris extrusa]|uniref:Uncharacterized protein n=1 Tax=Caerostris extrusa TaxID=172846 RepID=A0AAV4MVP2_CAEEX|nr:hypothetical protein CEXT_656171 [Caerostris extrusa]
MSQKLCSAKSTYQRSNSVLSDAFKKSKRTEVIKQKSSIDEILEMKIILSAETQLFAIQFNQATDSFLANPGVYALDCGQNPNRGAKIQKGFS